MDAEKRDNIKYKLNIRTQVELAWKSDRIAESSSLNCRLSTEIRFDQPGGDQI